jgi:FkbM family methyltransferase
MLATTLHGATHQVEHDGRTYGVRFPDSPYMRNAVAGIFAQHDYPFIPCLAGESGAVLDIGANIGATALLFRLQYPLCPVFAFEPAPSTFAYLAENAAALDRVQAFNVGLFDREAATRLYTSDVSITNSMGVSALNGERYEDVRVWRASRALDELGIDRIALIKMDTEGSEVPILRDLEDRLDRVSALFIEYHSERDRREIDAMLAERFMLYCASASRPHLGTVGYVSRALLAARTDAERLAITRPRL